MATGTLIQARAMDRLRAALYDAGPTSAEGVETLKREFLEDLRCAVEHWAVGFDQLMARADENEKIGAALEQLAP